MLTFPCEGQFSHGFQIKEECFLSSHTSARLLCFVKSQLKNWDAVLIDFWGCSVFSEARDSEGCCNVRENVDQDHKYIIK